MSTQPPINNGSTQVAIGLRDGRVVMQFPQAIEWFAMDPQNAKEIAEGIARASYEAHYGRPPPESARSVIGEEKLKLLTTKVAFMLSKLAEQGRSNGYVARAIIEAVLAEAT